MAHMSRECRMTPTQFRRALGPSSVVHGPAFVPEGYAGAKGGAPLPIRRAPRRPQGGALETGPSLPCCVTTLARTRLPRHPARPPARRTGDERMGHDLEREGA